MATDDRLALEFGDVEVELSAYTQEEQAGAEIARRSAQRRAQVTSQPTASDVGVEPQPAIMEEAQQKHGPVQTTRSPKPEPSMSTASSSVGAPKGAERPAGAVSPAPPGPQQQSASAGSEATRGPSGHIESRVELSPEEAQGLIAEQFRRIGEHVGGVIHAQLEAGIPVVASAVATAVERRLGEGISVNTPPATADAEEGGVAAPGGTVAATAVRLGMPRLQGWWSGAAPRWVLPVVAVMAWIGATLIADTHATGELRSARAHWASEVPALRRAVRTDQGRRWIEMLTHNPTQAIEDVEGCAGAAGLRMQVTVDGGRVCAGAGATRGWRLSR